jgi:hypothetical protein
MVDSEWSNAAGGIPGCAYWHDPETGFRSADLAGKGRISMKACLSDYIAGQ